MNNRLDIALSQDDLAEIQRRCLVADLAEYCHPKQMALVRDRSRRKAALCGRRSGKTAALAVQILIATLLWPDELVIAIALSRSSARELYGSAIKRICRQLGVECAETTRDGALYLVPEWGGRILLGGCSDRQAIEAYRGDRSPLIVVDEADSMRPYLRQLVEDVLEPRLVDLDGTLILTGTPGATASGYFHEITTGNEWSTHHWTMLDNPHLSGAAKALENARKTRDEGTFEREWMGRWFTSLEALCYPAERDRNGCTLAEAERALRGFHVRTVIGIDIGFSDPCAWAVLQHVHGVPKAWCVEAGKREGLTPSAAAALVMQLRSRYPGCRIVVDSGGIGKGYVEEWRQTHGVPCEAAIKSDVAGSIAEVAGALKSGSLMACTHEASALWDEWSVLQWDEGHRGHLSTQADHCSDALRYAFRAIGGLRSNPEVELTAEERMAKEDEREKERVHREAAREARRAPMVIRRGR